MKKTQCAYMVYRFENEDILDMQAKYRVCYFFLASGPIVYDDIKKVISDFHEDDELNFATKDELTEFSYRFIETHQVPAIYLINTTDFNIGLEASNDLPSLRHIFEKYGLKIELQGDAKGILGKFF